MLTFDDLRAVAKPFSSKAGSVDAKLEVHPVHTSVVSWTS